MNFQKINESGVMEGFCIIRAIEVKTTSKGSQYLDLSIADNDGDTVAKFWDYKDTPANHFEIYDFVKVRGTFVPFNDTLQFRIDRIRKVTADDGVNIDDYVPSSCLPGDFMLSEIKQIVETFEDEDFKKLVFCIFNKYEEQLVYWPAAKNMHHAVRGGLLMHTLSILRLCKAVCNIYTYLNYDLLCTGAILHDVTKILEIQSNECGVPGDYTVKGNLLGHLVMGAMEVDRTGRELEISEDKLILVEHMLISHHGKFEFGAAKLPAFAEALVLSMLDDMDAKLYMTNEAVSKAQVGDFSQKVWALDNRLMFRHELENNGGVNLED